MATYKRQAVYIKPSVLDDIRKAAKQERRTISGQIELIFTEWLKARKEK